MFQVVRASICLGVRFRAGDDLLVLIFYFFVVGVVAVIIALKEPKNDLCVAFHFLKLCSESRIIKSGTEDARCCGS